MATQKHGILTSSPEWWRHLRQTKRQFWKQERKEARLEAVAGVVDRTAAEVRQLSGAPPDAALPNNRATASRKILAE